MIEKESDRKTKKWYKGFLSQLWYAPHFCDITMLFLGCHTLPRGYRTLISHTWQQWPPFDPNRVYSDVLWVDVMTCWKFEGFFSWNFKIVFAIISFSIHRIQWNLGWKNYLIISFKCFQYQLCAPISLGAVIFWR